MRRDQMPEHWHKRQWRWRHNGAYGQMMRAYKLLGIIDQTPSLSHDAHCKLEIAARYLWEAMDDAYRRRVEEDGTIVEIKRKTVEELMAEWQRREDRKNKGVVF